MDILASVRKTSPAALQAQERNKLKRKQLLEEREAEIEEERRISKRTEWSEPSVTQKAESTLKGFHSLTEEQLEKDAGDPEHGASYFQRGADLPSQEVLRKWLTWHARTSRGKMDGNSALHAESASNPRITVTTMCHTWSNLRSAMRYFNQPFLPSDALNQK